MGSFTFALVLLKLFEPVGYIIGRIDFDLTCIPKFLGVSHPRSSKNVSDFINGSIEL